MQGQAKIHAQEFMLKGWIEFELGISKRQSSAEFKEEAGNGQSFLKMEDTVSERVRPSSWEGCKPRLGDS